MTGAWSFRCPMWLVGDTRINLDANRLYLHEVTLEAPRVYIDCGMRTDIAIRDCDCLILRGDGYSDADAAAEAGTQWRAIVTTAFAATLVPVDFRERAPGGGMSDFAIAQVLQNTGVRVINETPGVTVFETSPTPLFARMSAHAQIGRSGESVRGALAEATATGALTPPNASAFELWSASSGVTYADARFMLLMMATEVLIAPDGRPAAVQELVDSLIETVKSSGIDAGEKDSILGSLRWLKTESIGRAGKKLAATLGDRTYAGRSPQTFFRDCYQIRSSLVHGRHIDHAEVRALGADLERFVADLLQGPLRDSLPPFPGLGEAGDQWIRDRGAAYERQSTVAAQCASVSRPRRALASAARAAATRLNRAAARVARDNLN